MAFWSLQHGRCCNERELLRLQGHDTDTIDITALTTNRVGALAGNGFARPVIREVLCAAIKAAEALPSIG